MRPAVLVAGLLLLAASAPALAGATITISGGYVSGKDSLNTFSVAGTSITGSWNGTTGTLTLSGTDTAAHYQQVINTVMFTSSATGGSASNVRTVDVVLTDTTGLVSNTGTATITPLGGTGAPTLDLDADNSSGAVMADYKVGFNGSAVAIADSDVVITDNNSTNMVQAVITLTNAQSGDSLSRITTGWPFGITYSISGNTITLTRSDTPANYQTALSLIQFTRWLEAYVAPWRHMDRL